TPVTGYGSELMTIHYNLRGGGGRRCRFLILLLLFFRINNRDWRFLHLCRRRRRGCWSSFCSSSSSSSSRFRSWLIRLLIILRRWILLLIIISFISLLLLSALFLLLLCFDLFFGLLLLLLILRWFHLLSRRRCSFLLRLGSFVDVINLETNLTFDLRKHTPLLQRIVNKLLSLSIRLGVESGAGDLDLPQESAPFTTLFVVVVEIDLEGLDGHGVGVVDEELQGLVPLGVEVPELGRGAPPLSVEVNHGVGAGRALPVFRHQILGAAHLHEQLAGARRRRRRRRRGSGFRHRRTNVVVV
ncbi:hypothetical protein TorRG33x02_347940, partial [Trema orientale]